MKRRSFVAAAAGAPLLTTTMQAQTKSPAILEMRWFRCRNTMDSQRPKLGDFLAKKLVPALKGAGAGPVGLFQTSIGNEAPSVLLLVEHASASAFDQCWKKVPAIEGAALPFQRMEVQLLRGFPGFPAVEVPKASDGRGGRIFELRTYESNTPTSLASKIDMFQKGEIDYFRKYGLLPIFFGEMIAGPRMPNLTYMVAFDNFAAREANWKAFGGSPEWAKMRVTPGWADGEVVSNITNQILTPVAGSEIR
jgi:hypothetical protein